MGVRLLTAPSGDTVMYCSTTCWAFGPVFENREEAEGFLKWLIINPRKLSEEELERRYWQYVDASITDKED